MDWYDEHRKSTLTRRITSAEAQEAIALGHIIAREQDEDDFIRSSAKESPSPRRRVSRKPTAKKSAAPKPPSPTPPEKERIQNPPQINESEENESGEIFNPDCQIWDHE